MGGSVSDSTLAPGQAETFCGGGFAPNAIVKISVDAHVVGSATADSSGSFCTTLRITSPGSHVIRAKGTGNDPGETQIDSASVVVSRAFGPGGGTGNGNGGTGNGNGTGTGANGGDGANGTTGANGSTGGTGTGTGPGGLPFTGAEVGAMLGGAVLLLGAGAGIRLVARRRRSSAA